MCTRENVWAVSIVSSVDPSSIRRISHPFAALGGVVGLEVEVEEEEDLDVELFGAAPLAFRRLGVVVAILESEGDSFSSEISMISPALAFVVP